jgi:hypothetical protein
MKKLPHRLRGEPLGPTLRFLELLLGNEVRFRRAYKLIRLILVFLALILVVLTLAFIMRAPELVRLVLGSR